MDLYTSKAEFTFPPKFVKLKLPSPHPMSIIGFLNLIDFICNTSNVLQNAVSGLTQYRLRKF